jgi:hypothetical protein
MPKYSKIIFVQKEKDSNGDEYLLAYDSADDSNDGEVAVYELKKTLKKRTQTILE